MGTVYLAHDRKLDLDVALKVPHPDVLARPIARERFRRGVRGLVLDRRSGLLGLDFDTLPARSVAISRWT